MAVREKKTILAMEVKVLAVLLVVLLVALWRWLQRKRTPLVAEEQAHGVVTLDEAERAVDLQGGRVAVAPSAEVARVAGRKQPGSMADQGLHSEQEQTTDLEVGTVAAPLAIAFKETRCQTEEEQQKALSAHGREGVSQQEGAAQLLSVKEAPASTRASAERLDRDEAASAEQQDPPIDQHCTETASGLAAEELRTENDVYGSELCHEEQQAEAGMPGRLIAAEKPSGKGGVPVEMGPDLNSIARTSAGGKGPAKAETEPMGLERYAEVDRTEGVIRDLFVDNTGKCSGSDELVALTGQVIDAIGNNMERLTVLGALGRGKCGRVDEVQLADLLEGSYALKTIREDAGKPAVQAALVEMAVFARVAASPHNNVLGALAVDDTSSSMPMLLPKAAGDLESFMNNDTISLGDQLGLVVDLVRAAQHLHGLNVVHRDIKPANLLVFWTEELGLHGKLGDFGLSRGIGEVCPAMSGTPGFMAHECMSMKPVRGTAAQDVVGVAMVLLLVCLKKELRSPNLFANPALMKPEEWDMPKALFHRAKNVGENVSAEMELFQVELTKRTMEDGSFAAMILSAEQMNPALKSSEILLQALPSFLTTDPEERQDMASLLDLVELLAQANKNAEQEAGVEENVGEEIEMERACLAAA